MNLKLTMAIVALPFGLFPILTKSVSAAEVINYRDTQPSVIIAQRNDDHVNYGPRHGNRQENDRRDELRRQAIRQDQNRRENLRRDQDRRFDREIWIPAHYESGFLGLGRRWVEGHWETRR